MLDSKVSFEIHRLFHHEGWSKRKIAKHFRLSRKTVRGHLNTPVSQRSWKKRGSKIDPYKDAIKQLLHKDESASSMVILQRIRKLGYDGEISILRDYVRQIRGDYRPREAYIRYESPPGMLGQIDWGECGTLSYGEEKRKIYCFSLVECHSRLLYVEFTHSTRFETFIRCHVNAFCFFHGVMHEILYDNLTTAVTEHLGRFVRFNSRFLDFCRHYGFIPKACNKASPHEKGKIESGGIKYIKKNFWPLRVFQDLFDVNTQAWEWLNEIANPRIHRETRQRPIDRFQPDALRPLPPADFDVYDTQGAKVHKDLRFFFDSNRYCAPPEYVGKRVMVKADSRTVNVYDGPECIVSYPRCWGKYQVIGAEQFEKALLKKRQQALLSKTTERFCGLGDEFRDYLSRISKTRTSIPLQRQVDTLNCLVDKYGPEPIEKALVIARQYNAYGADYIENILIQMATPENNQPPVILKDEQLNNIFLDHPLMEEYDAIALMDRRKNHGRINKENDAPETQGNE